MSLVEDAKGGDPIIFEKELQLDENIKTMIKALVEQHNKNESSGNATGGDLIQGKGAGLVIMLHGNF